eukprot:m.134677 g.134677  ORF g.134677 m.134677 type:complete len:104 (+) comp9673_c0_seq1:461-772(+)
MLVKLEQKVQQTSLSNLLQSKHRQTSLRMKSVKSRRRKSAKLRKQRKEKKRSKRKLVGFNSTYTEPPPFFHAKPTPKIKIKTACFHYILLSIANCNAAVTLNN